MSTRLLTLFLTVLLYPPVQRSFSHISLCVYHLNTTRVHQSGLISVSLFVSERWAVDRSFPQCLPQKPTLHTSCLSSQITLPSHRPKHKPEVIRLRLRRAFICEHHSVSLSPWRTLEI